jgi:hypothetical protein
MKSVEIVLTIGEGGRRMMEGVSLTKIHCKHVCKYHNESFCTTNKY